MKKDIDANDAVFLYEKIISKFICLKVLVNDRGMHFVNNTIMKMTERFQIDYMKITPYHP